jgi:hypothetical protein
MKLLRNRTYNDRIELAVQQGRNAGYAEVREFLSHADKVYLETVTLGPDSVVTNSLFLGCHPYGIHFEDAPCTHSHSQL